MSTRERVAVVICCRDRASLLEGSLAAMRAVLQPDDELVVSDSASRDDSVRRVALAAGARVVRCELPGASRARNAGWRETQSDFVLFTDDDCRPAAGWAEAASEALAQERVGAVWGRVIASGAARGVELSTTPDTGPEEGAVDGDVSLLGHGANMALRREVLETTEGFDELLGAGAPLVAAEDKDLFWRTMRAGWRVRLAPDMVVSHDQWRDRAESLRVMYQYGVGAGAVVAKRERVAGQQRLLRAELWDHGLLHARRELRRGRVLEAAGPLARAVGVVAGRRAGHRARLEAGHFTSLR